MGKFDNSKLMALKRVDRLFKSLYLFHKDKKNYPPLKKESVKTILVVGMMMIGDTIMALPALQVLRRNFPNAKITIVGGEAVKTILENQGVVDHFIFVRSPWLHKDYSAKNLTNLIAVLLRMIRLRFDLSIDFKGDWRNIFFMNYVRSVRKVSFNYTGGEYMLTDPIKPNLFISHYIDEWLYLLEQIGCSVRPGDNIPKLKLSASDKEFVSEFIEQNKLNGKLIIGVHPGASQQVKKWDEAKYSDLIVNISNQYPDPFFIIFEGPGETVTIKSIVTTLSRLTINYITVKVPLHQYVLILSACHLVICNDSGAAHIAAAFAIPTVVIFGNVDPRYVTPYGARAIKVISHKLDCKPCHQSVCKFGTNQCIKEVSLDEVYCAAIDLLSNFVLNNRSHITI